ncbi:MAG: T9SS type A sorting domain-containing protein, partial [Wenyingzhuangia sp.]
SNSVSVTSVEKNKVSSIEVEQGTAPYKIFVNGEKILTSSASNITIPVVNGDVLEVFSNNDCEGSYRTQVFLEQEVRMYPNPTKDKINIYLSDQSEEVSIEVYNTLSKLILSKVYTPTNNIITIDLSHLPAGVYYLKSQVVKNNILKIIKR